MPNISSIFIYCNEYFFLLGGNGRCAESSRIIKYFKECIILYGVPKLFGKWWCGNLKSLEVVRVNDVGDLPRLVDGLAVLGLQ